MAILGLTIFGNTSYAFNSITGTKDRIKEIKIVEEYLSNFPLYINLI